MTMPPVPDYENAPDLTRLVRREIAEELWRSLQIIASKIVLTYDTHAIQVLIYPRSETTFVVPGRSPVTGVMRDNLYQE